MTTTTTNSYGNTEAAPKQKRSPLTIITYAITVVCLLLGLFLPFFDGSNILALMLPSAFGSLSGISIDIGTTFTYVNKISFFGLFEFDLNALLILLYAVITLIGIILLIPVLVSKGKKTSVRCSSVIQIAAAIVLFIYVFNYVGTCSEDATSASDFKDIFTFDWCVICVAFGGTVLMMLIQAIANRKASGVMKIVVWILGAVGVFALLKIANITSIFTKTYFGGKIGGAFVTDEAGEYISGWYIIAYFVNATFVSGGPEYIIGGTAASAAATTASIAISLAVLLALINFCIDTINLGAKSRKGGLLFDLIRYVLEVIAVVLGIIMIVVDKSCKPGLLMYVLLIVSVVLAVISIIRFVTFKKADKEKAATTVEASYVDDTVKPAAAPVSEYPVTTYTPAPAYAPAPAPAPAPAAQAPVNVYINTVAQTPAAQPAAEPEPEPAPEPAVHPDNRNIVYTVREVYNGPTDAFIARLTDPEKIEFAKLFIEKIQGSFDNIPEYVVNGDNKDFFSSIFIYLGTFRPLISEGLMNKIYNELNLLK